MLQVQTTAKITASKTSIFILMKLIKGYHITETHRKGILAGINEGYTKGETYQIGRTRYCVRLLEDGTYEVVITYMMTHTIGDVPRLTRDDLTVSL